MWSNVLKLVAAGATVVGAIAAIEAIAEAKEAAKKAAKEKADANFRRAEKAIDLEYKQAQEEFAKARAELDQTIHSISEDYAKACLRQYGMALSMLKASPDNEIILGMATERRRNLFEVQRDFALRFANTGLEPVDLSKDYTDQEMIELVKHDLAARA
jgi:hypothetical protein|nr:MAG TPA: hypothetical protein [Caudoviricetes sp.]